MTAGTRIRVVSLYDDIMNVYADRGNLIALEARARAHGVAVETAAVSLGDTLPADADLVLIGGGQDREQQRIADELAGRGEQLRRWADEGVAMLAVCGGFQLFGQWYRDGAGNELAGAGVFDVTTVAPGPGWPRCIGDVLAHAAVEGVGELVGFENHSGRTYLGSTARPFATVEFGSGNNGEDGTEGAVRGRAIGTYLHGSVLPRNPMLTDHLLAGAIGHRTGTAVRLERLPSGHAERAHAAAAAVARARSPRGERRERPAV